MAKSACLCKRCNELPTAPYSGSYCLPCLNARQRESRVKNKALGKKSPQQLWAEKNREKRNSIQRGLNIVNDQARRYHYMRQYGLTLEEVETLKGGPCQICGRTAPEVRIHIDHTVDGSYHGVLCHGCNVSIGQLGHDPERIKRAAAYVWRTRICAEEE